MYYSQFTLTSKLFQIIKRINRQPLHTENFGITVYQSRWSFLILGTKSIWEKRIRMKDLEQQGQRKKSFLNSHLTASIFRASGSVTRNKQMIASPVLSSSIFSMQIAKMTQRIMFRSVVIRCSFSGALYKLSFLFNTKALPSRPFHVSNECHWCARDIISYLIGSWRIMGNSIPLET